MATGRLESHVREELLAASDAVIEDAVVHADLLVLRGLLYQLTGDDEVARARLKVVGPRPAPAGGDDDDTALLRRKAVEFLKAYRSRGAGEISIGPEERPHEPSPGERRLEIDATQLISGKRLQGSNMGSNRFRVDMPQYVEWYLAGRLKLDELVSATMLLDKINDGFATLASGEVARQLILFD